MIGASRLSGDTMIACHFPVVQLPTWQLPVQPLCSRAKRPNRLCSVGLTRAVSLPEQDSLNREHAFSGGRRFFSSSYSSLIEDRAEEEGGSDSSWRYDSNSSPEETNSHLKKETSGDRGGLRSHNSFLPSTELDEEVEDSDGGNLHRYHEDSSFVLHGNSNWSTSNGARHYTMPLRNKSSEWGHEGTLLGTESDRDWPLHLPDQLDLLQSECQCFKVSMSGSIVNGEDDSDRLKDNVLCCIHSQHKRTPELFSNSQTEYISDSSCNSSEGILVNFCTIYNRSNNPATSYDLSSPAGPPSQSSVDSVFLNFQPIPKKLVKNNDMTIYSPPMQEVDLMPSASCWSPQGIDSNCNLFSLEPLSPGLSSLEVSDLTACLQSQATLAIGTNQKYYKLVTCDLSSQSPSPACSSCTEDQNRRILLPTYEYLLVDEKKYGQHKDVKEEKRHQQEERSLSSAQCRARLDHRFQAHDYQVTTTFTEKALCIQKHTHSIQNVSHSPCSLSPSSCSPHSPKHQYPSVASKTPSLIVDQEHCDTALKGACSLENTGLRYSKAQRPTSLPIQPFVLVPTGKPQGQQLGCLLEQYVNQKSSKSSSCQPDFRFRGKRSQCFSNLQVSPMGSYYPVFLEAPSSSDTCSTCTPSPAYISRRHTWSHSHRRQGTSSPCKSKSSHNPTHLSPEPKLVQDKTSPNSAKAQTFLNVNIGPNRSNLVKNPTYQDIINLTPEQSPVNAEPSNHNWASFYSEFSHTPPTISIMTNTHRSNIEAPVSPPTGLQPEKMFSQDGAAHAADSGFFHSSFTAGLFSGPRLSSLSCLLTSAASGLDFVGLSRKPALTQHNESLILSDRPPMEFCPSPDTSFESMSISHLQRRGLLRSVSRAVDLIVAHFGSTRDPEAKMRLGNSFRSPTIAGLVLEHLCPAIQNILEDGLRDHKLDLIIGQQRNHSWRVVEISAKTGPSTRILHSLVSKIRVCPQLSNHCMRLRAFFMGLLNLRALEFWLSHLQSLEDVVTQNYHSWGFLFMSLSQCRALFQELQLLLQPLSLLPFDLNLVLEPRLLESRQLCSEEDAVSSPQPCSALLVTSWPLLLADRKADSSRGGQQTKISHWTVPHQQETLSSQTCFKENSRVTQASGIPVLAPIPEFWPVKADLIGGVVEGEDCSQNPWSHISMQGRQVERREERLSETLNASSCTQAGSQGWLRWAKLFGAADTVSRTETSSLNHNGAQTPRNKRPSQWLNLDRSQLGLLAESIRSMKRSGTQTDKKS